jgi:hypothetical protein
MANPREPQARPFGWRPVGASPKTTASLARPYLKFATPQAAVQKDADFIKPNIWRGDANTLTLIVRAQLRRAAKVPRQSIMGSVREILP